MRQALRMGPGAQEALIIRCFHGLSSPLLPFPLVSPLWPDAGSVSGLCSLSALIPEALCTSHSLWDTTPSLSERPILEAQNQECQEASAGEHLRGCLTFCLIELIWKLSLQRERDGSTPRSKSMVEPGLEIRSSHRLQGSLYCSSQLTSSLT